MISAINRSNVHTCGVNVRGTEHEVSIIYHLSGASPNDLRSKVNYIFIVFLPKATRVKNTMYLKYTEKKGHGNLCTI